MKKRNWILAVPLILATGFCVPAQAQEKIEGAYYTLLGYYGNELDTLLYYVDEGPYQKDTIFFQQLPDKMKLVVGKDGEDFEISNLKVCAGINGFMYSQECNSGLLSPEALKLISAKEVNRIYIESIKVLVDGEERRTEPIITVVMFQNFVDKE